MTKIRRIEITIETHEFSRESRSAESPLIHEPHMIGPVDAQGQDADTRRLTKMVVPGGGSDLAEEQDLITPKLPKEE